MMHAGRTRDTAWLGQGHTRELGGKLTRHLILEANLRETWRRDREDRAVHDAMCLVAARVHPAAPGVTQDEECTELRWRVVEDLIGDMMSQALKYSHLTDGVSCELRTLASWMTRIADGRSAYFARVEALQIELVTPESELHMASERNAHLSLQPEHRALDGAPAARVHSKDTVSALRMATVLIDDERYQSAALAYFGAAAQSSERKSAAPAATLAQLITHFVPDSKLTRADRASGTLRGAAEADAFAPSGAFDQAASVQPAVEADKAQVEHASSQRLNRPTVCHPTCNAVARLAIRSDAEPIPLQQHAT
jgi:hypothetical protein